MNKPAGDHFWFLLKDPHWAFLYWEISPLTLSKIEEHSGQAPGEIELWLRIHDVSDIIFDGGNSHSHFDVQVQGRTDHWYLALPATNRVYCVELGCKPKGQFNSMLRSNPVFVPRSDPSDWVEERWATIVFEAVKGD